MLVVFSQSNQRIVLQFYYKIIKFQVSQITELEEMALEAAQSDGRLARRPLKNRQREIQAHLILLHHLDQMIKSHHAAIKVNLSI